MSYFFFIKIIIIGSNSLKMHFSCTLTPCTSNTSDTSRSCNADKTKIVFIIFGKLRRRQTQLTNYSRGNYLNKIAIGDFGHQGWS